MHRTLLSDQIRKAGFDIAEFVQIPSLNPFVIQHAITGHTSFQPPHKTLLDGPPSYGLKSSGSTNNYCLLVGSTKTLWPPFKAHALSPKTLDDNPLDNYSQTSLTSILSCLSVPCKIYFVNDVLVSVSTLGQTTTEHPTRIAFQKLGESCGFGIMVDGVGLQICKEYGPWFAYRAFVVFDHKPTCLTDEDFMQETEFAKRKEELRILLSAVSDNKRMEWTSKINRLMGSGSAAPFHEVWKEWVDVRMDIGVELFGKAKSLGMQYSNEQIEYHYTKNKSWLSVA